MTYLVNRFDFVGDFADLVWAVSPEHTYDAMVLQNIGYKTSEHRDTTTSMMIILNGEHVSCRHVVQQLDG